MTITNSSAANACVGRTASEEKGVELLHDIRAAFDGTAKAAFTTKSLIATLCADEERPWATYANGKPITDRQLAKLLKPFAIISETVQMSETGEAKAKGYRRERFEDAFARYLTAANADETATTDTFRERAESNLHAYEKREKPANHAGLHACTDKNPQAGDEGHSGRPNGGNGAARFRSDKEAIAVDADDLRHLTISAKSDLQVIYDELWLRSDYPAQGGKSPAAVVGSSLAA